MHKTTLTVLALAALLVAAGLLVAQERPRPGAGGPMGTWLDDLEKAYQQKNMDKVGELIEQMKQRRSQFPADRGPGGPPEGMRGPGGRGATPQGGGQVIESKPPVAKGPVETKILAALDEMNNSQRRGSMSVPMEDGRLLRLLAEAVGAKHVVEIGTSVGYSGVWQALALKATGGTLTTFEIDPGRAATARENFKKAGVDDIVTLVEGDAHEKVAGVEGPIDILFLDADKEGYIDYLNKLLPKVRPGGLIVAHNISPRQADMKYVEAITANPDLETLILNDTGGVSVTLKKRGLQQ